MATYIIWLPNVWLQQSVSTAIRTVRAVHLSSAIHHRWVGCWVHPCAEVLQYIGVKGNECAMTTQKIEIWKLSQVKIFTTHAYCFTDWLQLIHNSAHKCQRVYNTPETLKELSGWIKYIIIQYLSRFFIISFLCFTTNGVLVQAFLSHPLWSLCTLGCILICVGAKNGNGTTTGKFSNILSGRWTLLPFPSVLTSLCALG